MEELIKKVYEEKIKDGTIKRIISDEVEKMVKESCKSLFEWNGVIKKQMEEKIKEVMCSVVDNSDFSNYTQKLIYLINENLPKTSLVDYNSLVKSLEETCGKKALTYKDTIKLSDIFKKYCDFIENEYFSDYDFDDDDDLYKDDGEVTCDLKVAMETKGNKIKFYVSDYRLGDSKKEELEFEVKINKNDTIYYHCNKTISSFRFVRDFETYLIMLSNNLVRIEYDEETCEDRVTVEVEE